MADTSIYSGSEIKNGGSHRGSISLLLGVMLISLVACAGVAQPAKAVTFWVDDVNGVDSHAEGAGSSTAPFKTINYALNGAAPGDTVCIRGGTYSEQITPTVSGTEGRPITIAAAAGEAVYLEPTVALTGWTPCRSDDPCLVWDGQVHPNWDRIYKTTSTSVIRSLFENGTIRDQAQFPTPTHGVGQEELDYIPIARANFGQHSTLVDAFHLTQTEDFWNGCTFVYWSHGANNWFQYGTVTDFSAADHKLYLAGLTYDFTQGAQPDAYAIRNHPMSIVRPGQWVCTGHAGAWQILYWPIDTSSLTNGRVRTIASSGAPNYGLLVAGDTTVGNYLTIHGLTFRNGAAGIGYVDGGGERWHGVCVENCTFTQCTSDAVRLEYMDRGRIDSCTFNHIGGNGALLGSYTIDSRVTGCSFSDVAGTNIYIGGDPGLSYRNGVWFNSVGQSGIHGNGIAVYGGSDTLIAYNSLANNRVTFAIQSQGNVMLWGNIIDSSASGLSENGPATSGGANYYFHNIWVGNGIGLSNGAADHVYLNNIFARQNSFAGGVRDYNLFLASRAGTLIPIDGQGQPISLAAHECCALPRDVFVSGGDYHLKVGSAARGKGTDLDGYIATWRQDFPDFNFDVDADGQAWGAVRDPGPYRAPTK